MPESELHSWWTTVIIPALLARPLQRFNRQMVEQSTVELSGTTLRVHGGSLPIASGPVAQLVIATVEQQPPPPSLRLESIDFADMSGAPTRLGERPRQ